MGGYQEEFPMLNKRKPIALFLTAVLMISVLSIAVAAAPTSSSVLEVIRMDETSLQINGLPETLTNPVADLYTEERVDSKKIITYYAEDAEIVDGAMECNTGEVLKYDTEYILVIYNDDNDDEIRLRFTLTEEPEEVKQFSDVTYPCWYSDDLDDCVRRGLISGVTETRFDPDGMVTRAQVAQILYAMEGKPEYTGESDVFTDVPDGKWYTNAVNWASKCGVMSGYTTGKFLPNAGITRQQFMATLYKYTQYKGYDTTRSGNVESYDDYDQITKTYAIPGMQWAVGHGIMTGDNKNHLKPKDTTIRCEMAVVLSSYMENIVEK